MDKTELVHLVREWEHSPVWALCLEELEEWKSRNLNTAVQNAKAHVSPDYHLGAFHILDEVITKLPEIIIDKLTEREE